MKQLNTWLNRPYPLLEQHSRKWTVVIGFAVFTYVFLLLYQPYGAADIPGKSWYLAGFGASVFLVMFVNYFLLPNMLPKIFRVEDWQIKKEILYVSWTFIGIAIVNYLYNSVVGKGIAPAFSLIDFLGITLSVGIFPLLGLLYFNEKRLRNTNQHLAETFQAPSEVIKQEGNSWLTICAETTKDTDLNLQAEQFLFAVAESNYTTIHFHKNGTTGQQLLRLSLKALEQQLEPWEGIVRCHRSFLINKQHIHSIDGNARSLYLRLHYVDENIPVSRSLPRSILE